MRREMQRLFLIGVLICVVCITPMVLHNLQLKALTKLQRSDEVVPATPVIHVSPSPIPPQQQTPIETPVPGVDSPWYTERNTQLRTLILRNRPDTDSAEINRQIRQMYIDPNKPMVALTFDDGPKPDITDKILDILEQYHVRATFFVCGWRFKTEEVKDVARRAVALGCEIGNHTWDHEDMQKQNYAAMRYSVQRTNAVIYETTGYTPRSLRPPGGRYSYDTIRIARENSMAVVFWAQSGNVHEYDPIKIAQNVQKQIVNGKELQDGDIILLHDTKPHMVDAVTIIVPQLLEQGYQLVTVWELLNCSEEGFVPGELYQR